MALGGCGIALVATVFMEWGRARVIDSHDGDAVVAKLSFPGVGDVRGGFSFSDVSGEVRNMDVFYNTNPGWPAILFGLLIVVTAVSYWRLKERFAPAIAAATFGCIAVAIFAYQLMDLRSVFGDQAIRSDAEFSPGPGLLGATLLAIAVVGLGIAAVVLERRERQSWAGI